MIEQKLHIFSALRRLFPFSIKKKAVAQEKFYYRSWVYVSKKFMDGAGKGSGTTVDSEIK